MAVSSKDTTSKKLAFSITALLLIASLVVLATPVRANPGPEVEPLALYLLPESAVRAGDDVTFTYDWSNENGDQDAEVNVSLFVDDGSGPVEVDHLDNVLMEAGNTGSGELAWSVGGSGEYNLSVYFDYNDDDTSNNNLTFLFDVEPASGDAELFIDLLDQNPNDINIDEMVTFITSFGNNGDITPRVNISVGLFAYMGERGTDRPAEPVDEMPPEVLWRGLEFPAWDALWTPEEGGTYNIELIIDYNDNLTDDAGATDSDTENNIYFIEVDVQGGNEGVDLHFDQLDPNNALTAEPGIGVTDSHVTYKYAIMNLGTDSSDPGMKLALYVKTKNAADWPSTPTNTSNPIPEPIRGNDTHRLGGPMVELGWDIPTDAEGYWDIRVVVDYEDNVEETDETNNEMVWSVIHKNEPGDAKYFEVVQELPNLQIASIQLDGTPYAGEPINVTFEVTNSLGQIMAKDVRIEVKIYSYQNTTEWTEVTSGLVGDVGTDVPTNYVWSWTPPEVGDFEIKGYVDPQLEIEELNDNPNDNRKSKSATVREKLPDLKADELDFGPTTDDGDMQVGLPSYITLTMINDGLRELTQEEGDILNITFNINYGEVVGQVNFGKPLAKGASATVTFYLSAENSTDIKSQLRRNIAVEIDPDNEVAEIEDDYNNLIESSVYFQSTIDAFVTNVGLDMTQAQTKTPLEISFDIGVQNVPVGLDCFVLWYMDIVDNNTGDSMANPDGNVTLNVTSNRTTITYEWTPLLEGNYTIKLNIDYSQDSDDTNDRIEHNFSVKEFHTDLQIANTGGIVIDTLAVGDRTVTVTVGYTGDAASVKNVKVWIRVYDSTNWNGNWETAIFKRDLGNQSVVGSITQGDTRPLTYSWPGAAKGCYVIVAYVDPENVIHEDQEDNNQFPSKNIAIDNGCTVVVPDGDDSDDSPALGMFATLMAALVALVLVALRRRH